MSSSLTSLLSSDPALNDSPPGRVFFLITPIYAEIREVMRITIGEFDVACTLGIRICVALPVCD